MEKEYFSGYFRAANEATEVALAEDGVKPYFWESVSNHHEYCPDGDGNLYDSCFLPKGKYTMLEGDEAHVGIVFIAEEGVFMRLIKARKEYESIFGIPTYFRMFQDGKHCYISFPKHQEYYRGLTIEQAVEVCESLINKG